MSNVLVSLPDSVLAQLDAMVLANNPTKSRAALTKLERAEAATLARLLGQEVAAAWINSIIEPKRPRFSRQRLIVHLIELGLKHDTTLERSVKPIDEKTLALLARAVASQKTRGYGEEQTTLTA